MENIQMVDLKSQYLKIKSEIDTAVLNVIESTQYINGPIVKEFQHNLEKYLNVKHVIPCANGTDALQVAMMALDLKPGDEVIVPTFTFIATAEVIALLGLTPVFVDVDYDTFNISIEGIKKALTPKTKAIVPVHMFGQSADIEHIMNIAKDNNLFVIEDNAQAIGAQIYSGIYNGKKTGVIGDIGCTSFFPSKNLGCYGDGGAITTNCDELAEKLRMIVNHGMKVRYYHDEIGVNSRLDSIQAAILNVKLKYLDTYNLSRQKTANKYNEAFANCNKIVTPATTSYSTHVYHQYTLKAVGFDRNELIEFLKGKNIPAMVYYPVALHKQNAFKKYNINNKDFKVSDELTKSVFSLPIHSEMTDEVQDYIISSVLEFLK